MEDFDVAGGEAVTTQHRVDARDVVGVPRPPTPVVPDAGHEHRAVADLEQATAAGGAAQRRVRRLAPARVVAHRVARRQVPAAGAARRRVVEPTGPRRTRRREAGDVVAARQQLLPAGRRGGAAAVATSRPLVVVRILVDADQRDQVHLAATVEVAPTTASLHGVAAAPLDRQHHAVAVTLYHNAVTSVYRPSEKRTETYAFRVNFAPAPLTQRTHLVLAPVDVQDRSYSALARTRRAIMLR